MNRLLLLLALVLGWIFQLSAQRSGAPIVELTPPSLSRLQAEDERRPGNRFAAALPADIWPSAAGQTELLGGGRIRYSVELHAAGALGLAVFLDALQVPAGGRIVLRNSRGKEVGPFGYREIAPVQRLFTGFVPGNLATVEYEGPLPAGGVDPFHIFRVDYAYQSDRWYETGIGRSDELGFGTSASCNENANCTLGNGWTNEKNATCRIAIVVAEGTGYCTGTLINNTGEAGKPYLLTGFHCQDGFTPLYDLWRFDFNYRAADCNNPGTEPVALSFQGAVQRAGRRESDFLLLEIFFQP